jgi:hypothetical protein
LAIPRTLQEAKKASQQRPSESVPPKSEDTVEEKKVVENIDQPFGLEEVQEAIAGISGKFLAEHKNLELTLLKQPLEVNEQTVRLLLQGDLQMEVFQKAKPIILGLLREKLKNNLLVLEAVEVEEEDESSMRLYTSTDKLNHLKKKSPALSELQKRFGLETDF